MKAFVIPDVHLKPYMFMEAAERMRKGVADRTVCLMDIPDDWGREYDLELYVQTFDAAIAFAKEFPDTLWCYGNHDLCYVWNERESGYSWAVQVVGHTPVEKIYRSGSVISCDVFSTYRDGRPIGTQKYPVIDTVEKTLWKEV